MSNEKENENAIKGPHDDRANINMSLWVENRTDSGFRLEGCGLELGRWKNDPIDIKPLFQKVLAFRSYKISPAAGTEGWARYFCELHPFRLTIKWRIPFYGKGYLKIEPEGRDASKFSFTLSDYDPAAAEPNPVLTITEK